MQSSSCIMLIQNVMHGLFRIGYDTIFAIAVNATTNFPALAKMLVSWYPIEIYRHDI